MVIILQFYKYVLIENPLIFQEEYLQFCKSLGLLGRIYVAHEGINASISGKREQLEPLREKLTSDPRFEGMSFKEEESYGTPFRKMQVKIKNEICNFGYEVNVKHRGEYLEPKELVKMYEKKEDFVIVDARNTYESKIGRFKDAIIPDIENFRDFPSLLPALEKYKDKKMVFYCTGGIRCEKATAFLKEKGFPKVYHVKDGIINFVQKYPNTYWEGANFVFDDRMVAHQGNKPITKCEKCGELSDFYINCKNAVCNRRVIMCRPCQEKHSKCCTEECLKVFRNSREHKRELKEIEEFAKAIASGW